MVVHNAYLRLNHIVGAPFGVIGLATKSATVEVKNHRLRLSIGKNITVNARPRGGRKLHAHTAFLQQHLIVSGMGLLHRMAVMLPEVCGFQLRRGHRSPQRHQTHIDQVGAAGATEMGVGETVNNILVIVVARTRVPGDHQLGFGTQLHHSLGHGGTGEGAPAQRPGFVGLGADKGVYILGIINYILCTQKEGQQHKGR